MQVNSSNVFSVKFFAESLSDMLSDPGKIIGSDDSMALGAPMGTLVVRFLNGSIYAYSDVPISVYRGMVSAPSVGHYFWQNVRDTYQFTRLQ